MTSTTQPDKTLAEFSTGDTVRICSFSESMDRYERQRLEDMGMVPGTRVLLHRQAAFGGLRAFTVRGTRIALRKNQAQNIFGEKVDS